jgi:Mn-dependent DtxR family transcriptional regulator
MKMVEKGYVTLNRGPNWITEKGKELADSIIRGCGQIAAADSR